MFNYNDMMAVELSQTTSCVLTGDFPNNTSDQQQDLQQQNEPGYEERNTHDEENSVSTIDQPVCTLSYVSFSLVHAKVFLSTI